MGKNPIPLWGYAGVFPGEFRLWDGDEFQNKYHFMARHGFRCTGLSLSRLQEAGRLDFLRDFTRAHDFRHSIHFSCRYFEDPPETLRAAVDRFLDELAPVREDVGAVLVTTNCGPYHRFMRTPPLEFQLERLRLVLAPLAEGLRRLGLRVGIENHCDYYLTDLIGLCRDVPGLGIFWDTGNGVMTGEKPLDVSRAAAPWVVGCHFKDYHCRPDERELKLVVTGAALGGGDVGLGCIYQDLLELHPDPASLVMEFELIPDADLGAWESLERSKRFVERISGVRFSYPPAPEPLS